MNPEAHQRKYCTHHSLYHLTCEQLGALERAVASQCGICGKINATLEIDHDHAVGARAVRGMLCRSCNVSLGTIERGARKAPPVVLAYLADPWYLRVGLSGTCPPNCRNTEHASWLRTARMRRAA